MSEAIKMLEDRVRELGTQIDATLTEWREAEVEKRTELEAKIDDLRDKQTAFEEQVKEEQRVHLPGMESAVAGEKDAFSIGRACLAIAKRDFSNAGYEKEVFDNMRLKDQSQGIDTAGGFIVPEMAISSIIERIKAEVIAYDLGATEITGTGVPITIPRLSSSATGYWVAENAEIQKSNVGFEQMHMTPHTVAARVAISNLLLETSAPTADAVISQDIGSQLALAMDLGILNGSGASGQPLGLLPQITQTVTVTEGTGTVTFVELTEYMNTLAEANTLKGSLGFAMHPGVIAEIWTAVGTGTTLDVERRSLVDSMPDRILGYAYKTSTQMPAVSDGNAHTVFGNWADLLIARWGGMRLLASDTSDDAFSKDQTHIRATMRADVGVRHAESFVKSHSS